MRRAAILALIVLALPIGVAYADGVGAESYNYVSPPGYLKGSNQYPQTGKATIPFANGVFQGTQGNNIASTGDGQAGLSLPRGAVVSQAGQTSVRVEITPLQRFSALPAHVGSKQESLDGNVYRFRLTYQPSGKPITHLERPAAVQLLFPLTPDFALYNNGNGWKQLCSLKNLSRTVSGLTCLTRTVPAEVGMLRPAGAYVPQRTDYIIAFIVAIIGLGAIPLIVTVFYLRHHIRQSRARS